MYQFSGKIKTFSLALIILGLVATGWSFYSGLSTTEADAKAALLAEQNDGHHGGGHGNATAEGHDNEKKEGHETETHVVQGHDAKKDDHATEDEHKEVEHDSTSVVVGGHATNKEDHKTETSVVVGGHANNDHHDAVHSEKEQIAHKLHQMHNRPWSALYVSLLFFLGISLLVLAFYAAQRVAQSGWSVVLFRVMEAITANLVPTSIIMLVFIILAGMHYSHLFVWMDPEVRATDTIIQGKALWLNIPGWMIRGIIYLLGWNFYRYWIRKNSIAEDTATTIKIFKRNYNASVIFLVFFMLTESMAAWDWIMGLDPHWFSTLFGWYVLATLLVSAVTTIAFVTMYLRSKGYLPHVNDSHIHDLAKFMFGFSVFWTYLFFAQFMLIWYANIPEEGTYFVLRFSEYKTLFFTMLAMNFIFPILILLNSDFKSRPWFVYIGGILILIGHYVDLFVMIMPGTVGASWSFGIPEIGAALLFTGIFIYTVFSAFAKADPLAKGNPFLKESQHFHYYNIEHHSGDDNHH